MKTLLAAAAVVAGLSCSSAQAAIITFDDLTPGTTPGLYSGLQWNNSVLVTEDHRIGSGDLWLNAPTPDGRFNLINLRAFKPDGLILAEFFQDSLLTPWLIPTSSPWTLRSWFSASV
jgi:hypothetical protein